MYEIRNNCVDTFKDFVFIVAQRFIWTERDILDYTATHKHIHTHMNADDLNSKLKGNTRKGAVKWWVGVAPREMPADN